MFSFSKDQVRQVIKAYGKVEPNYYYVMRYKGDNQWKIYRRVPYVPEHPYKRLYFYNYDAYFMTDKKGGILDIRVSGTKDCFIERLTNAYYTSRHLSRNALCVSSFMINNVEGYVFRGDYCKVMQKGGASVLIDYTVKGKIFWV